MDKALIHDGKLQYINTGTVKDKKPKEAKWLPVIREMPPNYDPDTQEIKRYAVVNKDNVTVTYTVTDIPVEVLLERNRKALRLAAANYVNERYDLTAQQQMQRLAFFGNDAQKARIAEFSSWVDLITLDCFGRIEEVTATSTIRSTDFSNHDDGDPNVTVPELMSLT